MILRSKRYLDFIVYEDGDVYSFRHKRLLKNRKNTHGYIETCLKGKRKLNHRIVAKLFVPNKFNKPCVNHIDGNKENNHYSNLEWVTHKENTAHGLATGLIKTGSSNSCSVSVKQFDLAGNFVKEWSCINDIVKELSVGQSGISRACSSFKKEEYRTYNYVAYGYRWYYSKDISFKKVSKWKRLTKKGKPVVQMSKTKDKIKDWDYINQAAKTLSINKSSIISCCQNKRKKAGGFMWKYKNKEMEVRV